MAVSDKRKGEICKDARQNFDLQTQRKGNISVKAFESIKDIPDQIMRQNKDRKRPELQIYRPGMGLQNKNSKTEDIVRSLKLENVCFDHSDQNNMPNATILNSPPISRKVDKISRKAKKLNISENPKSVKLQEENSSQSKKNVKNRRPDLQVYTPKFKAVAMVKPVNEEILEASKVSDIDPCIAVKKHEKNYAQRNMNVELSKIDNKPLPYDINDSNCTQQKSRNLFNNRPRPKTENIQGKSHIFTISLQNTESWDELGGESDFSNSRSTPENCRPSVINPDHMKDNSQLSKHDGCAVNEHEKGLQQKRGPKNRRSKNNDTSKSIPIQIKNPGIAEKTDTGSRYLSWADAEYEYQDDNYHTSVDENISKPSYSVKTTETRLDTESKRAEKAPSNCTKIKIEIYNGPSTRNSLNDDGSKNKSLTISEHGKELKVVQNSSANNKNKQKINHSKERKMSGSKEGNVQNSKECEIVDAKDKKFKRDKPEQSIAPRFQKQNKALNSPQQAPEYHHNEATEMRSRGILRLPTDSLAPEIRHDQIDNVMKIPNLQQFNQPVVYMHKQLFNPKNPDAPEIVNIPTIPSASHLGIPNYHINYVSPGESTASSIYGPASPNKQSFMYIPPPQPLPISHSYQFQSSDFPLYNDMSVDAHGPQMVGSIAPPVPLSNDTKFVSSMSRPPSCYSEYVIPQDTGKKKMKPIVEKNMNEIMLLERELTSHIAKGLTTSDLNVLRQCRWKIQLRYENIILADPRYCAERNAEQYLWKSAFYQIIESLRKSLDEQPQNKEELKENLLNFVNEGTVFYENLLEKQQETYGFNLSQLLEMEYLSAHSLHESIRLVLISCQKILIYLGDLSRYKEQANGTTNYGKARSWYLKAQHIAPKNGRPYHQLAVLALCARRKLDAVYYFIRSLAASNAFLSAREYLLTLFEDAKKKYEQYEKKRLEENRKETEVHCDDAGERCEVWIKPDGSSTQRPAVLEDRLTSEIQNLSNVDLNKRFVTSFLHVHGKLFTKVGMETFTETIDQMLKEFYFLLQRTPITLRSSRLLQLSAINMFAVANASLKDLSQEGNENSVLQEQALQVCQTMMSLVMDRCCALYKGHVLSPEYPSQLISDDLAQLLPAVKTWTDWMSCQRELWSSVLPPTNPHLKLGYNKDVWSSFADLLTVLGGVDTSFPEIVFEKKEGKGLEPVFLEEDNTLCGFVPLLGALQSPAYVVPPFDKDKAKNSLRISRIQYFGDYLCGIPTPYLEFDVEHKKFISLVTFLSEERNQPRKILWDSPKDDSFGDETPDKEDLLQHNSSATGEKSEIQFLWSRKEALSRTKAQQEKQRAQVQAVLQKNQSQRPIALQIQPRYLIPDTNCFIDHLQFLKNILATAEFNLVVPLVVINELDGLARGTRQNAHISPEHANKVTALSREAITFLEHQFAVRNPHLRAITSKGSVMDTISFRSEEMSPNKGTNDDLILSCCLYYCKDRAELYMPKDKDEPLRLLREVVLLTDDRNLRVKALTHNVPARDLLSFLQWVNS